MRLLERIDRIIGFVSDDPVANQFSRERVSVLRRFIGFYYLAIIAPFAAVAVDHVDDGATWFMGGVIVLAVTLRFRHWAFPVPPEKSEAVSATAARLTGMVVIALTLAQLAFYATLAMETSAEARHGMFILSIGVVAGLTQAQAVTGIIFAARVLFLGLLAPLLLCIPLLLPIVNWPVAAALLVLCGVAFRLAEAGHETQLELFSAQFEADSARKRAEEVNGELHLARKVAQTRADTDSLTGARNRFAFLRDMRSRIDRGGVGVLMLIDLDRFKPINDLYGHHSGDQALRYVARRLQRSFPGGTIIGRLGGDEFGVYIEFGEIVSSQEAALELCDRALARLRRRMRISNASVRLGASGGARVIGKESGSVEDALRDADFALYTAKKAGMHRVRLFEGEIRRDALRTATVVSV